MSRLNLTVHADGIAVVTLTDPPVNALDAPLLEELAGLFEGLAAEPSVRAAVLTGEGRAFSAGLDLKRVPELDWLGRRRLVDAMNECFGALYAWPKPLVAAVNGHAIAGGMILALCADWRVVADVPMEASLAEVRVGVTYPVAPLEIARRELAPTTARRLILLGETLGAREAQALHVFDEHTPAEALMSHALVRARRYAELPPNAFATTKRELRAEAALAHRAGARRPGTAPDGLAGRGDAPRRGGSAAPRGVTGMPSRPLPAAIVARWGDGRCKAIARGGCCYCCWRCRLGTEPRCRAPKPLEALVKATLMTLNDANLTGDYRVFHAQVQRAVPPAIHAGPAEAELQANSTRRTSTSTSSAPWRRSGSSRPSSTPEGKLVLQRHVPDRADPGQLRDGLRPLGRRLEADPHQRQGTG